MTFEEWYRLNKNKYLYDYEQLHSIWKDIYRIGHQTGYQEGWKEGITLCTAVVNTYAMKDVQNAQQ